MVGKFAFLDKESLAVPDEESWVFSNEERSVPLEPESNAKKDMCCFTCLHFSLIRNSRYFLYAVHP